MNVEIVAGIAIGSVLVTAYNLAETWILKRRCDKHISKTEKIEVLDYLSLPSRMAKLERDRIVDSPKNWEGRIGSRDQWIGMLVRFVKQTNPAWYAKEMSMQPQGEYDAKNAIFTPLGGSLGQEIFKDIEARANRGIPEAPGCAPERPAFLSDAEKDEIRTPGIGLDGVVKILDRK